jgi:hypothetical protein
MASVDETPGSPLSIDHLYQTLQHAGKAAHDAFAREKKNEDDQKVLEHAIMIMVALRKQAPFKGTRKTKRDLQGVWKAIKGLEMPCRGLILALQYNMVGARIPRISEMKNF